MIHLCGKLSRDEVCREYGVPRLHVGVAGRQLGIALTPSAKFADSGWISWGKNMIEHVCSDGHLDWGRAEECPNCGLVINWPDTKLDTTWRGSRL